MLGCLAPGCLTRVRCDDRAISENHIDIGQDSNITAEWRTLYLSGIRCRYDDHAWVHGRVLMESDISF